MNRRVVGLALMVASGCVSMSTEDAGAGGSGGSAGGGHGGGAAGGQGGGLADSGAADAGFDGGMDAGADAGADAGPDAGPDAGCLPGELKVLVLVDQSGSMCVTDAPGDQSGGGSGFCSQIASLVTPPGVTEPARVKALKALAASFQGRQEVMVRLVPFETNPQTSYPGQGFARSNSGLVAYLSTLQTTLGKGTDYEGALVAARDAILADVAEVGAANPKRLARTRYVVILLVDGPPFPRCSANDALPSYATSASPGGVWPDSSGAGSFCNDPMGLIADFDGGDRNQNARLLGLVDEVRALAVSPGVGDVRFHAVLLHNDAAQAACGNMCQDIYGTYPGVPATSYAASSLAISRYLLGELSTHGGGMVIEKLDGAIQQLTLLGIDAGVPSCP